MLDSTNGLAGPVGAADKPRLIAAIQSSGARIAFGVAVVRAARAHLSRPGLLPAKANPWSWRVAYLTHRPVIHGRTVQGVAAIVTLLVSRFLAVQLGGVSLVDFDPLLVAERGHG